MYVRVQRLFLSHSRSQPIPAGFSYGLGVDNSRDAAHDVYDFLQKFFTLFPQYAE